jgi:energy-coupling factor transporter ATP-binding protein EcfA2
MIERIDIRNYRSCFETSFELQPDLSVLIGPNGSGKTNLLNACVLLRKLTSERLHRNRSEEQATSECRLKMSFRVKSKRAILTAKLGLFTDEHNADVIVSAKESWYAKDFTGSALRVKVPLSLARYYGDDVMYIDSPRGRQIMFRFGQGFEFPPESFKRPFLSIARYLSEIKYYSASQFTNPSKCPVSFQVGTEGQMSVGTRGSVHNKFLFDLFTEFKGRENSNYNQFLEVIGPKGIGLVDEIDFKEIPTSSIEYSVRTGSTP